MVYNTGLMERTMKVNGAIIKPKVRAHFGMPKEIFTEVSSKTIWRMVTVNTHISMVLSIKVSLKKMFKKVTVRKNG
jgi:hypothetical protein